MEVQQAFFMKFFYKIPSDTTTKATSYGDRVNGFNLNLLNTFFGNV
jgi:hypothetical protein